jgi:hypothetical protein
MIKFDPQTDLRIRDLIRKADKAMEPIAGRRIEIIGPLPYTMYGMDVYAGAREPDQPYMKVRLVVAARERVYE